MTDFSFGEYDDGYLGSPDKDCEEANPRGFAIGGLVKREYFVVMALTVVTTMVGGSVHARDKIGKERVRFESGSSSATITGTITGYEAVDFVLGARAGQTMTVEMKTDNTANYFNLIPPDSEDEAIHIGSVDGENFDGVLDLDGDWKIRVYLMRSAARRGENARFTIEVAIRGSADPAAAREANDFGPREWDARGDIGCAFGGEPMRPASCAFKVIRYPSGGTVFVARPGDRGVRVLYFDGGKWSTDSAAEVVATKRSDLWTLTLDEEESYEIPEAVLTGG